MINYKNLIINIYKSENVIEHKLTSARSLIVNPGPKVQSFW